ncbi:hypothetical protein C8J57DRAFT_1458814 [Mycena rebaudengoi]|nr:hypothetical protein C8J57DRAFT_1458814 [Mycena rebaudengoi]
MGIPEGDNVSAGAIFGIAMSGLLLGGIALVLVYLVTRQRAADAESRERKSILYKRREKTWITPFALPSPKQVFTMRPSKEEPPAATNRYESVSRPKPVRKKHSHTIDRDVSGKEIRRARAQLIVFNANTP